MEASLGQDTLLALGTQVWVQLGTGSWVMRSLPLWGSVPLGIIKLLALRSLPGTYTISVGIWFHLVACWGIWGLLGKMEGIAGNKIWNGEVKPPGNNTLQAIDQDRGLELWSGPGLPAAHV